MAVCAPRYSEVSKQHGPPLELDSHSDDEIRRVAVALGNRHVALTGDDAERMAPLKGYFIELARAAIDARQANAPVDPGA